MVVACISLFVALGGVGYAAATIGSAQIKNNSIRGKDIRNGTIRGKDVRNNTLTGADVLESRLGKVPSASRADSASIARVKTNTARGTAPASGDAGTAAATCDSGLTVLGGGVQVDDPNNEFVVDDWPSSTTAFSARVASGGGVARGFTVYAICAPAATTG